MIAHPPFATIFLQRMTDLGLPPGRPYGYDELLEHYKRLPWKRVVAIARRNDLDFIIQFREVSYRAQPIYANDSYAVYEVP
jgi:hypothetical protein